MLAKPILDLGSSHRCNKLNSDNNHTSNTALVAGFHALVFQRRLFSVLTLVLGCAKRKFGTSGQHTHTHACRTPLCIFSSKFLNSILRFVAIARRIGGSPVTLAERSNTLEELSALPKTRGWNRLIWSAREGTSVVLPTDNSVRVAIERDIAFLGPSAAERLAPDVSFKSCPVAALCWSNAGGCVFSHRCSRFFTACSEGLEVSSMVHSKRLGTRQSWAYPSAAGLLHTGFTNDIHMYFWMRRLGGACPCFGRKIQSEKKIENTNGYIFCRGDR